MPTIGEKTRTIENEAGSWPGAITLSHRFGGIEFRVHEKEFGHIHYRGLMDILFNNAIRKQLLLENKVSPHHLYPDSGWTSFYLKNKPVDQAIWLLRLSYLFQLQRRKAADKYAIDIHKGLTALHASEKLVTLIAG